MSLDNFIEKMKASPYSNEYVEEIDGKKYFYSGWDKKIFDVTEYENNITQITHACLERHINNKVDVINFVRDYRGDWADDGGYCFYVGKYDGKYILGSNYVSYNLEFSNEFKNTDRLEEQDENIEYMFFDSLLEIENYMKKIMNKARELTEENEDWGYESWDLEEEDFESEFMHLCVRNLGSAFCESPEKNEDLLLKMTTNEYIPQYLDPSEFYGGWVEDDAELDPVVTL